MAFLGRTAIGAVARDGAFLRGAGISGLDNYEIGEKIVAGKVATVYKDVQRSLRRLVVSDGSFVRIGNTAFGEGVLSFLLQFLAV